MDNERKTLRVKSVPSSDTKFIFTILVNSKDGIQTAAKEIELSGSEMNAILETIKFTLPYMNGWHALTSSSVVKSDLTDNIQKLKRQIDFLDNIKNDN